MSFDLVLNATVIGTIIVAATTAGIVFIKRYLKIKEEEAKAREELRLVLFKLSDSVGKVTIGKVREVYGDIRQWGYKQGDSKLYKIVLEKYDKLREALERFSMSDRKDSEVLSEEDWKSIKQLRNALYYKAGAGKFLNFPISVNSVSYLIHHIRNKFLALLTILRIFYNVFLLL